MRKKADLVRAILSRGTEEIIVAGSLRKRLESGKKLRVKLGIDPTSPDLHLGHAVLLRKLRQFQDAGHTVIFLIGDFTARIGDPSGRSEERKVLSEKEILKNASTYLKQAGKIVDIKKAEVRKNSEWYKKGGLEKLLEIVRGVTIQQVLRRDDFDKRIKAGINVSFLESLYPILQGYDSVALKADIELGGTDQKFNLLMGRHIQGFFKEPLQDVIMMPLLEGTDGVRKMSKSYQNSITLESAPSDMFGKVMSVPDGLIQKYFTLLTDEDMKEADPYRAKRGLASLLVRMYHGAAAAKRAEEAFTATFSRRELPAEMPEIALPQKKMRLVDFLVKTGVPSKSEARRLIAQGAIQMNQETMSGDEEIIFSPGDIVKIGKKRFLKVK